MEMKQRPPRPTRQEIIEFMGELGDDVTPLMRTVAEERWLARTPTRIVAMSAALQVPILAVDRAERQLFRKLEDWLAPPGASLPHPVYDMDVTEAVLDAAAERVKAGTATHATIAKELRMGTRRIRDLLGSRTRMMGRLIHGAAAFLLHGCKCEVCESAMRESLAHYLAGGDARQDIAHLDMAPCQESPRVFFSTGHHDPEMVLRFAARVGLPVNAVRNYWWKKQRARLWWLLEPQDGVWPVTVAAQTYDDVRPRTRTFDKWIRRWRMGNVEDEVISEVFAPGERRCIADCGWTEADGFPCPLRQSVAVGVEWCTMPAPESSHA